MGTEHDTRNWLHRLLMAIQAADAANVLHSFAEDGFIEVRAPEPDAHWTSRAAWAAFVEQRLDQQAPGALMVRLIVRPEVSLDEGEERPRLTWQVAYRLPGSTAAPVLADCEANLIREDERWVAARLVVTRA